MPAAAGNRISMAMFSSMPPFNVRATPQRSVA